MNDDAPFIISPLRTEHDRANFTCGVEPLDRYLRHQAAQDTRRRIATCFVAHQAETCIVRGYYTLSATNVLLTDLPTAITKRLPRYPTVPAAILGRLAIASACQGRKLGAAMLADAVDRSARADIATYAIVVDPKDASARAFYERHGFQTLLPSDCRMFTPIESALRFLQANHPP